MRLRENEIITPALLRRFEDEGKFEDADGRFYSIILRDDRSVLAFHPFSPVVDPTQMMWAVDVLKMLNRELHHDGAWVCVFTHVQPQPIECVLFNPTHAEYGRYCLIWLDQDGDAQFTVEWERGISTDLKDFSDVLMQGLTAVVQKCEMAWTTWRMHMRDVLDPKANQLYRRAKGERAPSV